MRSVYFAIGLALAGVRDSRAESKCLTYGNVVAHTLPRIVAPAGEFCYRIRETGQPERDGLFVRRWDVRKAGVNTLMGSFEGGVPAGVWQAYEHALTVVVRFENGEAVGAAIWPPGGMPARAPFSIGLYHGKFEGNWAFQPGEWPTLVRGTVSEGRLDGEWGDALGSVLGTYARGHLSRGEPVPVGVTNAMKLVKARLPLIFSMLKFDKNEKNLIRDAIAKDGLAAPQEQ